MVNENTVNIFVIALILQVAAPARNSTCIITRHDLKFNAARLKLFHFARRVSRAFARYLRSEINSVR